ncbi:hypothetical protein [Mycobacterium lepromatosis]|uniref:hypothetical protein n=1 Tax=Mycobacterium lepromatosis TaxID=480418 RepID=UPI001ED98CB8|nr:hypothetical protein [Mycobacterium lepromatosis]
MVSEARDGDGAVLLRVATPALGIKYIDWCIANMCLQAGSEVSFDNARHAGFFLVEHLAAWHGVQVGL